MFRKTGPDWKLGTNSTKFVVEGLSGPAAEIAMELMSSDINNILWSQRQNFALGSVPQLKTGRSTPRGQYSFWNDGRNSTLRMAPTKEIAQFATKLAEFRQTLPDVESLPLFGPPDIEFPGPVPPFKVPEIPPGAEPPELFPFSPPEDKVQLNPFNPEIVPQFEVAALPYINVISAQGPSGGFNNRNLLDWQAGSGLYRLRRFDNGKPYIMMYEQVGELAPEFPMNGAGYSIISEWPLVAVQDHQWTLNSAVNAAMDGWASATYGTTFPNGQTLRPQGYDPAPGESVLIWIEPPPPPPPRTRSVQLGTLFTQVGGPEYASGTSLSTDVWQFDSNQSLYWPSRIEYSLYNHYLDPALSGIFYSQPTFVGRLSKDFSEYYWVGEVQVTTVEPIYPPRMSFVARPKKFIEYYSFAEAEEPAGYALECTVEFDGPALPPNAVLSY